MEQENEEFISVYAPRMHGALIPSSVPDAVLRLDPGLSRQQAGMQEAGNERSVWRPQTLPLDEKQARAWLRSMLGWGMQFETPGQLASVAAVEALHKQREIGGMDPTELAELKRFSSGAPFDAQAVSPQERHKAALLQAQLHLLLAWNLEERSLELSSLGKGLHSQYERFGQALGLEQDQEASEAGLGQPVSLDDAEPQLPVLEVLAAMLAFVPEHGCLYSEDQRLVASWQEQGLSFITLEERGEEQLQQAFSGQEDIVVGQAPGWRLAGRSGPFEDMPWLEREFLAVCRTGQQEAASASS